MTEKKTRPKRTPAETLALFFHIREKEKKSTK